MKTIIKALIAVIIVTLLLAGVVYAYQTLWSGKARITIEPPTSSGQLEITDVVAGNNGTWDNTTKTWVVSIGRGEYANLTVHLQNTGGDAISYLPYINNHELSTYIAPGVYLQTTGDLSLLAAGASGTITYRVDAYSEAEPASLPEVTIEIRQ